MKNIYEILNLINDIVDGKATADNLPEEYADVLQDELRQLSYDAFLKTKYWRKIAYDVKRHADYTCYDCGYKTRNLHVHHLTYKNHGAEHLHKDDLICLCNECHKMRHDLPRHAPNDISIYDVKSNVPISLQILNFLCGKEN